MKTIAYAVALLAMNFCANAWADSDPVRTLQLEGWTVHIRESLYTDMPEKTDRAIELLTEQLKLVVAAVPKEVLPKLREVPLYVSPTPDGWGPKAEYHPSRKWLEDNGRNPDMAQCVEFTNVQIFDKEVVRMPVFVLHELAHAYHHRVLGYEQSDIESAYKAAVASKSYDAVPLRANGQKRRAYAMTNKQEYFAETSEAFFGINDFFPFNREDLKKHDPTMHDVLAKVWKVQIADE